jgi:hypothetical protein
VKSKELYKEMSSYATPLPGQDTLIACWRSLAKLSPGARVVNSTVAVAAVFPSWAPLNNAITLPAADGALAANEASQLTPVFADAGVDTWALWLSSRATDLDAPDRHHYRRIHDSIAACDRRRHRPGRGQSGQGLVAGAARRPARLDPNRRKRPGRIPHPPP